MQEQDIALVVDLDGTLSRTDTLHEALLALVTGAPGKLLQLPGWLGKGKAALKAELADIGVIDPAELPLNEAVLESLRVAREAGRRTALVSAADHRQVTAVAEAVGLFDEAYGTAEGRNLKGAEKAAFLTAHYGDGKFDYIGDSRADLPVWAAARQAITVEASPGLRQAAEGVNPNTRHISPPQGRARAMLKAMRPHQWAKNALLLLPMLAGHDFSNLVAVILGIVAFCLTASAVYVINDLIDLGSDRAHPRKRNRPFASGALSAATGAAMAGALLGLALIFGMLTGNALFLAILAAYLAATFAYSFWLKGKLIVDILMLASLYTIRIIAGGAAASVVLSPWMLGFSMFLFLALAAVKRQAELTDQMTAGFENTARAYRVDDLPILRSIALSASQAAVLVLALYISSGDVQALYETPEILWLICPLLLYWLLRMVMKAHRGEMTDDPIVFAFTDSVCIAIVILCASITVAAAI